ncbi:MAG TPA: hypothetical protein VH560_05780 [Polyangia bacterium]|jgi:hypothetical protein|nr:hypothetical protein [Polyangia bacterium]
MSNTLPRIVLVAALLLPVASARADDSSPAEAAPPSSDGYRLQTFAVDASSLALFMGFQRENSGEGDGHLGRELLLGALGGYLLGGPIIHAAHGHGGRAIADFFLRAALPVLGAVIGDAASKPSCHGAEYPCGITQTATGFVVGAAAAAVIDIALLSGPGAAQPPAERVASRARSSWTLAPSVAASSTLALVGVGGRF